MIWGVIVFQTPDFASAFVGTSDDGRAIYSYTLMVESLMLEDNMSHNEAIEFIDYNAIRALPYMGEKAPIIVYDIDDE